MQKVVKDYMLSGSFGQPKDLGDHTCVYLLRQSEYGIPMVYSPEEAAAVMPSHLMIGTCSTKTLQSMKLLTNQVIWLSFPGSTFLLLVLLGLLTVDSKTNLRIPSGIGR